MPQRLGKHQQKILLLLLGGVALTCARSPRGFYRVIKIVNTEWKNIARRDIERAISGLYKSKLVSESRNSDGTFTLVLTKEGKKKAFTYDIQNMRIKKPKQWDKKWRIVLFDIPEPLREKRDVLRFQLKYMGFYEFQKSVFIHPYDCKDEIEYLIEFYTIRKYVRFVVADSIDNEALLKKYFSLL